MFIGGYHIKAATRNAAISCDMIEKEQLALQTPSWYTINEGERPECADRLTVKMFVKPQKLRPNMKPVGFSMSCWGRTGQNPAPLSKLKDRITPQVNFFRKFPVGRGWKDRQRRWRMIDELKGCMMWRVRCSEVVWRMVCDIDVCERWCVTMLHVTKVCVCVRLRVWKRVCGKDVCENWCVEDVCWKMLKMSCVQDGVWQRCVCKKVWQRCVWTMVCDKGVMLSYESCHLKVFSHWVNHVCSSSPKIEELPPQSLPTLSQPRVQQLRNSGRVATGTMRRQWPKTSWRQQQLSHSRCTSRRLYWYNWSVHITLSASRWMQSWHIADCFTLADHRHVPGEAR